MTSRQAADAAVVGRSPWARRARRCASLAGTDRSAKEAAIFTGAFALLGLVVFAAYVHAGGFAYDDWGNYSIIRYGPHTGLLGGIENFSVSVGYRPGSAVYVPVIDDLLGLHAQLHAAWNLTLAVALSGCVFHVLRLLDFERRDAAVAAALLLLWPFSDVTRLYVDAGLVDWTILLFVVGLIFALHGLAATGRRAVALHAAAVVLYVLAVLTYEMLLGPILLVGLVYRLRTSWRPACQRWAVDVIAAALAVLRFNFRGNHHPLQSFTASLEHVRLIWTQGLVLLGRSVFARSNPSATAVLAVVIALVITALAVQRRLPPASAERSEIRRWLAVAGGGVLAVASGYLVFVPAESYYSPGALGVGNRTNGFAAVGYVIIVCAAINLVAILLSRLLPVRRRFVWPLALAASVLVAVGYVRQLDHDAANWDAAFRTSSSILDEVHRLLPRPPDGSTIYIYDHPVYWAPGIPVFAGSWDFNGAVKASYRNGTLSGQPGITGSHVMCTPTQIVVGGASPTDYGKSFAVDVKRQSMLAVTDAGACSALQREYRTGPAQVTSG